MPTIEQLDPVVVASDDDMIPVSQSGAMRRVTRAQLLSGVQAALSLTPGLLGRSSQGLGGPEHVVVGGGLSLANGVLSGQAPFSVSTLQQSSAATPSDLVPISQAGRDRAVSVASLLSTAGIDMSGQSVSVARGVARRLSDWMTDSVAVEAYGAVGDGETDDGPALRQAVASGLPVRLGPKAYRIDGQWTITTAAVLLGIPGLSTLRRRTQTGGAWIDVSAPRFTAIGVTFDGGGVATDSWGVLIESSCTQTLIENCTFANVGGQTLGCGLVIQARDGLNGKLSSHSVVNSRFSSNAVHGLWIQAASGALVQSCAADQNVGYGICLDYNDAQFQQVVRQSAVIGCRCWGNGRGISVGNYNETNSEPPRWGLANPDAVDIAVIGNVCSGNSAYGIAASGERIQVCRNQISCGPASAGSSGVLCNASRSLICGNVISGPGMFGIDAGGCVDCDIDGNLIDGFDVGVNAGGGQGVRVSRNRLLGNQRGVTAFQVETDGHGGNFGLPCQDLSIEANEIVLKDSSGGGIILADGPQGVAVIDNSLRAGPGSHPGQALLANTDDLLIRGNRWNGSQSINVLPVSSGSSAQLISPEIFDTITVSVATPPVTSISGEYQASLAGRISFIKVTNGGTGYHNASVSVSGSGSGATAAAYVRDGAVIGITLVSAGVGFDAMPTVTITGDGQGATAQAFIGLPVPNGRRLRVRSQVAIKFVQSSAGIGQSNSTGSDITIPAGSEIVWEGVAGGWNAVSFNSVDYLAPTGNGAVSLRSLRGDLTLSPGAGGSLRITSPIEASGFMTCLGRGSPEGVVAASPGSDFRNLDGGVGTTLWIKRVGVDRTGWVAIA